MIESHIVAGFSKGEKVRGLKNCLCLNFIVTHNKGKKFESKIILYHIIGIPQMFFFQKKRVIYNRLLLVFARLI